ncbi:MAG: M56 family metallopeptidase [Planctomycetota bacterium]
MNGIIEFLLPRCVLSALVAMLALAGERILRRRLPEALAGGVWGTVLLLPFLPALPQMLGRGWIEDGHRALQSAVTADTVPVPETVGWILVFGAIVAVSRMLWTASMSRGERRTRRRNGVQSEPAGEPVRAAFAWAQARLGSPRSTRIELTTTEGPAVVGWWRPVIRLPRDLAASWTEPQLRHVFLHECAHLTRRDPLRALAVDVLTALLWFHPAARVARRRLAELRELATDRQALRAARELSAEDYRRTLLELARPMARVSSAIAFGDAAILQRLRALEHRRENALAASRGLRATALLLMLLACTPITQKTWETIVAEQREAPGCLPLRYAVLGALAEAEASSLVPSQPDSR